MIKMMKSLQHLVPLLFLTLLPLTVLSSTNNDLSSSEATQYSTLPPTVFSPTGRLFGVERVARESMMLPPSSSTSPSTAAAEESCCTVLAIRCGPRRMKKNSECEEDKEERGELTIMMGIGPISPSLHCDVELYNHHHHKKQIMANDRNDNEQQLSSSNTTTNSTAIPSFYKPLQLPQQQSAPSPFSSSLPIAILSPTLITATGGTSAIDSSILLRRSIEVALSLYKLDNGGIDLFASSSLEGPAVMRSRMRMSDSSITSTSDDDNNDGGDVMQTMSARRDFGIGGGGGGGGASNVKIETLVRRIANMAQSSTQNLGGKYGRMLSSSLLAMGVQSPQSPQQEQQSTDDGKEYCDKLCIWRVDPTGQFWKCDASAVGRGTVEVEEELLSRVRLWKMKKNEKSKEDGDGTAASSNDDELHQVRITNNDIRSYLSSLTEEEAVQVASDCLVNGILNCKGTLTTHEKRNGGGNGSVSSLRDWMEYDLRRRMHCVILRSTSCGKYEVVRRL